MVASGPDWIPEKVIGAARLGAKEMFAMRLKELRKKKKMTQTDLAEASGLAVRTVQAYEQGLREPSLDSALKLAHGLRVDVSAFDEGHKKRKKH